jgi:hypothetical protein
MERLVLPAEAFEWIRKPVRKYAPGQARDGHGRFANGGIASSSTGVIDAVDPEYAKLYPEAAAQAQREADSRAQIRAGGTEGSRMASKVEKEKYDDGESDLLYETAKRTDRAVNADHRLPAGFGTSLQLTASSQYAARSSTVTGQYDSGQGRIWVAESRWRGGDEQVGTLLHEMGHRMDHVLAIKHDSGYTFASEDRTGWDPDDLGDGFPPEDNAWGRFRTAVEGTQAWKKVTTHPNKKRGRYLRSPTEVFARAYQQYVRSKETTPAGLRFGDPGDLNAVTEGSQWSPEEFGPVSAAIEGILKSEGLK